MDITENTMDSDQRRRRNLKLPKLNFPKFLKSKKFLIPISIFLALILVLGISIIIPGLSVIKQSEILKQSLLETKASLATKDLNLISEKLTKNKQELETFKTKYNKLKILKYLPFLNNYYKDGNILLEVGESGIKVGNLVLESVKPYQDFLGLKIVAGEKEKVKDSAQTTEERINFLVESVNSLKPQLDEITKETNFIQENLEKIDSGRYPEEYKNIPVRNYISQAQRIAKQANRFISQGRPLIEKADWLLGKDEPRNYLFLFQNDAELRPTGGFWTAYGILKVDNGNITPQVSQDIYALDAQFNSAIPAPEPIEKYHKKVYYWYLRDMNLSPDFETSVETFLKHYNTLSSAEEFDGIFAIDTQVLVDLLSVLGRIGVPGWGNFTPEPDERCWGCPQVVYYLESLADKPVSTTRTNRKGFLAPLMHSILANAMGSPKEQVVDLANMVFKNLKEKHVLIYFPDPDLQKAVTALNIAGKIVETNTDDYFYLNNCNFAGAKSNLFITEKVKHEYKVDNNKITKKVTVTYKNSAPASNCNLESGELCLNGLYRNWFRFYLPKDSEFIKMTGSEVDAEIYNEAGKTVMEGFYGNKYPLYPKASSRVTLEYTLPIQKKSNLSLYIQKQPGTKQPIHEIWVNGKKQNEIKLDTDQTINIDL